MSATDTRPEYPQDREGAEGVTEEGMQRTADRAVDAANDSDTDEPDTDRDDESGSHAHLV